MSDNKDYTGVLLEDMNSKMDAVVEAVGQMQGQINNLPTRDEFQELRDDVKVIKKVVTGHSEQLTDHEERLTTLEVAGWFHRVDTTAMKW